MGLLDAPPLTSAAADKLYPTFGGNAAILMGRLALGQESAVMLVLGDSTGVIGASPWPLLVARWLAAKFPAYTVNYRVWDDTAQGYKALGSASNYPTGLAAQTSSQVVQTGTGTGNAGGPYVLDIYNASVSGTQPTYPIATLARWNLTVPAAPQLVLVNYGHNTNGATDSYRTTHFLVCRAIQQALPEAGVVQVAQNPRAATDTEYHNDLIRARAVMMLAGSEGHGLVNVTQRFLADPSYASSLLLGDGLHPNDTTGSAAWADEVQIHLAQSLRCRPQGPLNRSVEHYIPASALSLGSAGTATLGQVNGGNMGWSMPAGVRSDVIASFNPPDHWSQFDIFLQWTVAAGNAAQVVAWGSATRSEGLGISGVQLDASTIVFPITGTSGWSDNIGNPGYVTKTPNTVSGAYPTYGTQLAINYPVTVRPLGIKISRRGDNAADTFTNPAILLGVRLLRRR